MAKTETLAADGRWLWYGLGAIDLGVHQANDRSHGLILEWKGHVRPDALKRFFKGAAQQVSDGSIGFVRLLTVTNEGPSVVEKHKTSRYGGFNFSTPERNLELAEFVQLEGLPGHSVEDDNAGSPIVAVFSNQDRRGKNLDERTGFVGVYLGDPKALTRIDGQIADLVEETHDPFSGDAYDRGKAVHSLKQAIADLGLR